MIRTLSRQYLNAIKLILPENELNYVYCTGKFGKYQFGGNAKIINKKILWEIRGKQKTWYNFDTKIFPISFILNCGLNCFIISGFGEKMDRTIFHTIPIIFPEDFIAVIKYLRSFLQEITFYDPVVLNLKEWGLLNVCFVIIILVVIFFWSTWNYTSGLDVESQVGWEE